MNHITQNPHIQPLPTPADSGRTVTVSGMIYKIRRMSGFAFLLLQTGETLIQCVWSPDTSAFPGESLHPLREQSAVTVTGVVKEDARVRGGFEVHLVSLTVLSAPAEPAPVVINGRNGLPMETDLSHRPFALRREETRAVFRIQAALSEGCAEFFSQNSFVAIHTPKICAGTAESGAGVFPVDYFGRDAFLATSPQLYKQMMTGVFGRVYEIGPVFRAEPHDTARHLNEYTGIDCEVGFVTDVRELMEIECAMLTHALAYSAEHAAASMQLLGITLPDTREIPAIPFADAKAILAENGTPGEENDLSPAEEKALCAHAHKVWHSDFVFVTEYPTVKRPFYAKENAENPLVTESFDLLFRGMEITTGGLRIHNFHEQVAKMRRCGIDPDAFSDYLSAHKNGLPPHGGFGVGLERLCACLCGFDNVRHASLFPRDVKRLTP
ncbi:MAG: aspartate--tRNA(Asn) ligase [Clostridia bacterium]|nr:aspartate--tRNA(Asn) ligase [Clostridia bacterium]